MNQFYTPGSYLYPQAQMPVQNRNNNGIIWVNGEEGARSWVMAPNSNAVLFDLENDGRFYIKTTDNIGMCTIRSFNYKELIDVQPVHETNTVQYATKQDVQELRDLIDSIMRGGSNEQSLQSAKYAKPKTYGIQPAQ